MATKAAVKEYAKKHGVKVRYNSEYSEWDICGYLTTDNDDAMKQIDFEVKIRDWKPE